MRTKNGKRIGPVPITLVAVFALAALLSAGLLLAPNGAPTAEAQENTCEVEVAAGTTPTITLPGSCDILGDTAMVKFNGAATSTDDQTLTLLIQDNNGPITAYPNGTGATAVTDGTATSMRYRYQSITIPEAKPNPTTGIVEGQSVTITVRGDVHIWNTVTSVTTEISGIADDHALSGSREIAADAEHLAITFFGSPAIGKDSANDRNSIVDDYIECLPGTDGVFDDGTTNEHGNTATCNQVGNDIQNTADTPESRSIVQADDLATFTTADVSVLDGGEASLEPLIGTEDAASIRATIKDAKNQILEDVEVTFTATSNPVGIEDRERSYDTADTTGQATHVIQGLPTSGAYRVTVVVTAEGLDDPVGTIIIARAGPLETLTANACTKLASDKTDTDMMDGCMDNYDPKPRYGTGDDVTIHAAATDSLGTDVNTNEFSVKPGTAMNWWNSLDCMEMNDAVMPMGNEPAVGPDDMTSPYCKMYADLEAGAKPVVDRAFSDRYGDVTKALDITTAGKSVTNGAAMFTVADKAPGGHYLLFVEAKAGAGTKRVTKTMFVRIAVAGDTDSYMVAPMGTVYTMAKRVMFTVTARDENGIVPNFITTGDKANNKVMIDALYGSVRGVNADGYLMLDADTGIGTFTYTLPRDVMAGEDFEIIIGEGEMEETVTVVYGDEPMAPGMPMMVNAMATSDTEITVSWDAPSDGGSAITGYMVQSAYMMSDGMMSEWMDVDPAHSGTATMYMDTGLTANTKYYYRVAAMNAEGMGDYSDGMAYAMTDMAPTPPMASGMLSAVSLMVGDDPAMVDASGAFTMTEGDAITGYNATSSNDMVATASADAMGMVTITAVGAGSATVSVTAMDDDGTSAAVTIMVTVTALPAETAPPTGGATSVLGSTISVTWTPGSATSTNVFKVALFNEDVTALADIAQPVKSFNTAAADPGAHDFSNVPSGTYTVVLAAVKSDGMHVTAIVGTATVN